MQDLTQEEQAKLLGKKPEPPLYYKFGDYKYNTNSKERVLSGIDRLDELTKGFKMGCITIWTGLTNARENNSYDNDYKTNNRTRRKGILL